MISCTEGIYAPPVATAISSFFTTAINAIKVLVISPDIPNPEGTIAIQSNHSGVFVVKVDMTIIESKALPAIEMVSQ